MAQPPVLSRSYLEGLEDLPAELAAWFRRPPSPEGVSQLQRLAERLRRQEAEREAAPERQEALPPRSPGIERSGIEGENAPLPAAAGALLRGPEALKASPLLSRRTAEGVFQAAPALSVSAASPEFPGLQSTGVLVTGGGDSSSAQRSSQQKPKAARSVGKDARSPTIKAKCGVGCSRGNMSGPNSGTHQDRNPPWPVQLPAAPWYLALPPAAAPVGFTPTITLAPCAPASAGRSCSPPAPTSTSTPAGPSASAPSKDQAAVLRQRTCWQPSHGHCCSLTLDCDGLGDLNWYLNRAVEAAKDMKVTTKRMSQSLTLELRKARSCQGSCLF